MGGRLATGENGIVTALANAGSAVEFGRDRVPYTRHSRRCLQTKPRPSKSRQNGSCVVKGLSSRIQRLIHHFQLAVSQGHSVWLAATIRLEKAVGTFIEDSEGQEIAAHAIKLLRQRCNRLGHSPQVGWGLERGTTKRIGLHLHVVLSCPASTSQAAPQRVALHQSMLTALEVSEDQLKAPSFKIHTPLARTASASEAFGWWQYIVSGAVPAGQTICGIAGKTGNSVLAVKSIGWSVGRHV